MKRNTGLEESYWAFEGNKAYSTLSTLENLVQKGGDVLCNTSISNFLPDDININFEARDAEPREPDMLPMG